MHHVFFLLGVLRMGAEPCTLGKHFATTLHPSHGSNQLESSVMNEVHIIQRSS